jgi:ABC transporter substrate binding protein
MGEVSTIGLDIAKSVFQIHGVDAAGTVVIRKRITRAKLLEFFAALSPCLVGIEACPTAHHWSRQLQALGHTVRLLPPSELTAAFTALERKRPDALVIASDAFYLTRASELVSFAAKLALPTMYPFREFSQSGGLVSYGTNRLNNYRLAGVYASRILKGAKPADLPVMQPTVFELVINLRTAKVLGLAIPDQLLALADEVIE